MLAGIVLLCAHADIAQGPARSFRAKRHQRKQARHHKRGNQYAERIAVFTIADAAEKFLPRTPRENRAVLLRQRGDQKGLSVTDGRIADVGAVLFIFHLYIKHAAEFHRR
ncbi:MAG: hypothetical protein DELT_03059 [Desulfovibrio sp.]